MNGGNRSEWDPLSSSGLRRTLPRATLLGLLLAAASPAPAQEGTEPPAAQEEEIEIEVLRAATEAARAAREAAEAAREAAEAARLAVVGATPAPRPEGEPVPPAEETPPVWSGQATASVISLTGNANTVTASLSGSLDGEWRGWATRFTASGSYGRTRPEDAAEAEITALAAELGVRGERKFSEFLAAYVAGGVATDHVASIELRAYGEPGAAITWLERVEGDLVRSRLRTDLGFRVAQEERYQYFPDATDVPDLTLFQLRAAVDFRYALTKTTVFTQAVEALEDLSNTDDFRLNAQTVVAAQVYEGLALQLAFEVRHNGNPAPGKVETDTRLSAGVTATF